MNISKLQNDIIKQVLSIEDQEFLKFFKEILMNKKETSLYKMSEFEKTMVSESRSDYNSGNIIENDAVFKKNNEWLEE
ncbi:hypothetical protein [Aquimarina litoralis]|uniref:hypothetical protein n=1 Tax=Aquimarina litoralis TaxID=584605 RepID=UPI001C56C8BF|nr:hypothetical protein [Aquimarina litoralis]MBW1298514.1 hypothetical protein [Aquimarina litoralis]